MRKTLFFLLLPTLVLGLISSCQKDEEPDSTPEPDNSLTYTADIQPILFNWCTTCHAGSAPSAGVDLTTYENVKAQADNGILKDRVTNTTNPMPPSGLLPESDQNKIVQWIAGGAPK